MSEKLLSEYTKEELQRIKYSPIEKQPKEIPYLTDYTKMRANKHRNIIKCPKCGLKGEIHYPNKLPPYVLHKEGGHAQNMGIGWVKWVNIKQVEQCQL